MNNKHLLAEMTGTFAIVFCGTGAVIVNNATAGTLSHTGVAMTWGLIVMAMIYTFCELSGAHFNPAVSIAFAIAQKLPARYLFRYILSQCAGAFLASGLLRLLFPSDILLGATQPAGTAHQSFLLEVCLSFLLMLVILQLASGSKETGLFSGVIIGAVVGLEAMFAGPVCGASMNPARSLAPAIVSGQTAFVWLYLLAPVTGMLLAVPLYGLLNNVRSRTAAASSL